MKNLLPPNSFQSSFFVFVFFLMFSGAAVAQSTNCGCKDQVNVTLNGKCSFKLTLSNVQAGNCNNNYRVIVNDENPGNGDIIDCAGLYTYGVFDGDNLVCWGNVLAEDKTPPVPIDTITTKDTLECFLVDFVLNNPNTVDPAYRGGKYYLGEIKFQDNCAKCGCHFNKKFYDQVEYFDCDTINANGKYAEIRRRWTATDCNGYATDAYQTFTFIRPRVDTLKKIKDVEIYTCDPASAEVGLIEPQITDCFGDKHGLSEVGCNLSMSIEGPAPFQVCDDGSYKIERYVRVLDWCAGTSDYIDTFIVKVGDFQAPHFSGNATTITGRSIDSLRKYVRTDSFLRLDRLGKLPTISTGPFDCTAAFSTLLPNLKTRFGFLLEDCGDPTINVAVFTYGKKIVGGIPIGDSIWQATNYPMQNNMATNIPVGLHALLIEANDNCKNNSKGIVFFQVKDKVAPVMKCDDQFIISLTTGHPKYQAIDAYARLDAIDVDENSWDNCALGSIKIRRTVDLANCAPAFIALGYDGDRDGEITEDDWYDENGNGKYDKATEFKWEFSNGLVYTPWRDFVEFTCCDVDQAVTIELGGWDAAKSPLTGMAMPNFNSCWMTILIEDPSKPELSFVPEQVTRCDDEILQDLVEGPLAGAALSRVRKRFGEAEVVGNNCGTLVLEESIVDKTDHCGFGLIERVFQLTKTTAGKGQVVTTAKQIIRVTEKHDYWVYFPKDERASCVAGLSTVDSVKYQENGCDLIAVSHTDERFYATSDPNACYKVFRTYRVINWCEYDGESNPVIVSRDWDNWNGCDAPKTKTLEAEYDINPTRPDGDDKPGDEGIYIIVQRTFEDGERDVVYYDRDRNPFNTIPDNPNTEYQEGYWWKVVSGNDDPDTEAYYQDPYRCSNVGVWGNDPNEPNADPNGSNQADDNDYRYGSYGFWQYTQHIVVYDNTDPEVTVIGPDTFCSISNLDCSGEVSLVIRPTDPCTKGDDITVSVQLDDFNDGGGLAEVSHQIVNDTVFQGRFPIGTHRLVIQVNDGCGNKVTKEHLFTVQDCKKPAPICINGLSVELMPSENPDERGMMVVWASDFVSSPIGDCSGQGPELVSIGGGVYRPMVKQYSINRIGDTPQRDSTGLRLTCEDAGELVVLEIHAWDEKGLHDFCETYVEVQDNGSICAAGAGAGVVAGAIMTENKVPVEGVEVQLSGARSMMYMTDKMGQFSFEQLVEGHDYSITPNLDRFSTSGVSTFDLVLIQKHILGTAILDSPYKMIAADANNSRSISTLDIILLRKLILNIDSKLSSNKSWRFIEADYVFPQPKNPWAENFPEVRNINNLTAAEQVEFVAVKIGDVNQSVTSNLQAVAPRSKAGKLEVFAKSDVHQLLKGKTYTIEFEADISNILGYQFTLDYLGGFIEILDLKDGIAEEENFGVFKQQSAITTSWNISGPVQVAARKTGKSTLFSMVVRAKATVELSRALSISSRLTMAEAYSLASEPLDVVLRFDEGVAEADFDLYQNTPNPFQQKTTIGFELDAASPAVLTVQDVTGKVIKVIEGTFVKGYNEVQLNAKDLPASGVFFYKLEVNKTIATRKMILLE